MLVAVEPAALAYQLTAGDTIRASFADVAVAMVDPRDIAEVVAAALIGGGADERTYRLSGPQALTRPIRSRCWPRRWTAH